MNHYRKHVFVCANQKAPGKKCCSAAGGDACFDTLKSQLLEKELFGPGKIRVTKTGCLGRCSSGPCVVIYPEGVWYRYESMDDIDAIVKQHLQDDSVVKSLKID